MSIHLATTKETQLSLERLISLPEWDVYVSRMRTMRQDFLEEASQALLDGNLPEATKLAAKAELLIEVISLPMELFKEK